MYSGCVPRSFQLPTLKLTVCEEVCCFGRSRLVGDKATSEEESVPYQVVVKVIIDELPKLAGYVGDVGRRHFVEES